MKKVFLSMAAIAFVATGSLTMTSCGSDDSTPNPGPEPDPELTENYVKYDGGQYELDGSEYTIDTVDEEGNIAIYSAETGDDKYVRYATYFWSGDIESATSVADLNAYGMVSYYVQLENVQFDEEGNVVDFDLPFPNEADLEIANAGAAFDGETISGATAAALNVNTFVVEAGSGTSDFDGSISFDSDLTFDYNGVIGFFTNNVSAGKSAKGISKFKQEIDTTIGQSNSLKLEKSKSTVTVSDIIK